MEWIYNMLFGLALFSGFMAFGFTMNHFFPDNTVNEMWHHGLIGMLEKREENPDYVWDPKNPDA